MPARRSACASRPEWQQGFGSCARRRGRAASPSSRTGEIHAPSSTLFRLRTGCKHPCRVRKRSGHSFRRRWLGHSAVGVREGEPPERCGSGAGATTHGGCGSERGGDRAGHDARGRSGGERLVGRRRCSTRGTSACCGGGFCSRFRRGSRPSALRRITFPHDRGPRTGRTPGHSGAGWSSADDSGCASESSASARSRTARFPGKRRSLCASSKVAQRKSSASCEIWTRSVRDSARK